jgi:hypothetical protein
MKIDHVVSWHSMIQLSSGFDELVSWAGVCDLEALKRAVAARVHERFQWQMLIELIKHRAKLRYDRGELKAEERTIHARWCGEAKGGK